MRREDALRIAKGSYFDWGKGEELPNDDLSRVAHFGAYQVVGLLDPSMRLLAVVVIDPLKAATVVYPAVPR